MEDLTKYAVLWPHEGSWGLTDPDDLYSTIEEAREAIKSLHDREEGCGYELSFMIAKVVSVEIVDPPK